jgi:8-oxo-dGTP diphosphatase
MSRVLCAVKALMTHQERFLVLKQRKPDGVEYWDFPGGRMHHGETPHQTLLREVKEETGLEVTIGQPAGCFWFFRDDGDQVVCFAFHCEPTHREIDITQNIADEDIQEFRWVSKEEFLSGGYPVAHESVRQMMETL